MRLASLPVLALALLLAGCAGYKLGPTSGQTAGARSVEIWPFINNSPEPGLADEVTAQVRKLVQRDGTLRLATHRDSDWIVTGVITDYQRRELSLAREDVRTVRDYQISISAKVTVKERATGALVMERTVNGGTLIRVGADLTSSERQATPLLAGDLAQQVTDLLVNGDW
jgi:hypothetical protein